MIAEPPLVSAARQTIDRQQCVVVHEQTGFAMAYSASEVAEVTKKRGKNHALNYILLDTVTAGLILLVYEMLDENNKATFDKVVRKYGCSDFVTKLWKLV